MTDSKVIIHDYHTLIQLNDALDYCGDSLLKLLREVDDYLQSCLRAFEEQRDFLKERLEFAEQALQETKSSLSACESSQYYDEKDKCYYPTCEGAKEAVEDADKHYYDCKDKYEEAVKIVSDCEREIENYKFRGAITPPGGEKTLEYLAKTHTDEAQAKMNKILELVEKYLGRPLQETDPNESLPPTKAEQFKEATEQVQRKQKDESRHIADANVSMVCSGCHRPIPICICARLRERVNN